MSFLDAPAHAQQWLLSLAPGLREKVEGARAYLFPGWITLALAAVAVLSRARGAGAQEKTKDTQSPSPWWVKALDGALVLVAVVALVIRVSDGIDWKVGSLNLTARTAGRAFALFEVLAVARLLLARLQPSAFAPALRRAREAFRRTAEAHVGLDAAFYVVLALLALGLPRPRLRPPLHDALPAPARLRSHPRALAALRPHPAGPRRARGEGPRSADRAPRGTGAGRRGAAVVALLTAELAAFPLETRPYALDLPAIDRELAARPRPFTVVELPVADPANATQSARLHSHYMLHSMAHWQPMVNGYSGIIPPRHERLFRILTAFPDTASLRELEGLGVRYAVVHREFYDEAEWARFLERAAAFPGPSPPGGQTSDGRLYSLAVASSCP